MEIDELIKMVAAETNTSGIYVKRTLRCYRRLRNESQHEITLDIFDGGTAIDPDRRFFCVATTASGRRAEGKPDQSLATALASIPFEDLDSSKKPARKLLTKKDVFDRVFGGFGYGKALPPKNGDLRSYKVIEIRASRSDSGTTIVNRIIEDAGEVVMRRTWKRWAQMATVLNRYIVERGLRVVVVVHDADKWKPDTLWNSKRIHEYEHGFAPHGRPAFVFLGQPDMLSGTLFGLPDILARSVEVPPVPLQLINV